MITEIEIQGFKSFENVRLKLGGLNLFIGANASGKSNFFDALRVLQGIGYGFTVDEIFNGKPKGATSEAWEGIRGGSGRAHFTRRGQPISEAGSVHLSVHLQAAPQRCFEYAIDLLPASGRMSSEVLKVGSRIDLQANDMSRTSLAEKAWGRVRFEKSSLLGQIEVIGLIRDMQRIDPLPSVLRQYSQSSGALRMGERGESFATLVKLILRDDSLKSAYLSWLRQLTPLELDDVTVLEGALGEPLFALREGDSVLPAPILSDGTLRFAAITAAFFQSDMPKILTLEEIENGIHPSRLRLLLELLKSQSRSGPQVFATTHSPVVLAWLDEKDYETTFLCKREEETGASVITPLSEIPHLIELVRKQPIGELFTEGWLEGAF
ncbi:MAG TPA: ATP-binding protein [Thermoanaerobaculia bacterium]|nr:ATP-binding protein [Thermoanaerobaculia bacterium]